jgi:hypothetical protein
MMWKDYAIVALILLLGGAMIEIASLRYRVAWLVGKLLDLAVRKIERLDLDELKELKR